MFYLQTIAEFRTRLRNLAYNVKEIREDQVDLAKLVELRRRLAVKTDALRGAVAAARQRIPHATSRGPYGESRPDRA